VRAARRDGSAAAIGYVGAADRAEIRARLRHAPALAGVHRSAALRSRARAAVERPSAQVGHIAAIRANVGAVAGHAVRPRVGLARHSCVRLAHRSPVGHACVRCALSGVSAGVWLAPGIVRRGSHANALAAQGAVVVAVDVEVTGSHVRPAA
jgi:hypothetical protein